jgi:hypothetical protein
MANYASISKGLTNWPFSAGKAAIMDPSSMPGQSNKSDARSMTYGGVLEP